MKVSYCSTCKGRLWQLEKTLMPNLLLLNKLDAEWIIVDYASPDDIEGFLRNNSLALNLMKQGKLKVYRHDLGYLPFSVSLAKNLAHHFASGEYVFNLDIDNYIGNSFDQIVALQDNEFIWALNQTPRSGLEGRLGMKREVFEKLGGYDLALADVGYDDINLGIRLQKAGFKVRVEKRVFPAIVNTAEDTIQFAGGGVESSDLFRKSKQIHDSKINSNAPINPNGTTFIGGVLLADLTSLLTV